MKNIFKIGVFLCAAVSSVFSQSEPSGNGRDLSRSEPFWRQALGGTVLSLPHVQAQSAVIAIDGGNIRAYSASGTPMWFYSARGRISPFVTRSREGTSYLSRTNGLLIAVNRAGRELWRRGINDPLCANVVIGWDGRLFVPTDKKISCYTASGTLLWTKSFDSSFYLVPKLDRGGGIIFTLENNNVYHVDPFGNEEIYTLSGIPAAILSVEQQKILALYRDRSMEILDSEADWFFSAVSEVSSSIVVLPRLPAAPLAAASRGSSMAAVLDDGRIAFVSLGERRILWEGDTHIREISRMGRKAEMEVEILFDERGVFVLSKDGACGFSIDGRRLWYTLLENTAAIPAFGDDGVLYSGGNDWILYAYKIEDRSLPDRGGIFGPAPEGYYDLGRPHPVYLADIILNENDIKNKLEQIDAAIKAGRVGTDEPAYTTFLITVSSGMAHIQNRVKALQLLGQIGSWETVPFLMRIFNRESEPLLKAAAVSAVGAIGVDPEGIAIQNFLYSVIQTSGIKDEQVLLAIVSATGALCRFSGPPLSETGIRILNLLTENPNPAIVKRQANIELATLR